MTERIIIDPQICHGQPIIRGTRVPVTVILSSIEAGDSFERIASEYGLTTDDIRAAVAFARDLVGEQTLYRVAN